MNITRALVLASLFVCLAVAQLPAPGGGSGGGGGTTYTGGTGVTVAGSTISANTAVMASHASIQRGEQLAFTTAGTSSAFTGCPTQSIALADLTSGSTIITVTFHTAPAAAATLNVCSNGAANLQTSAGSNIGSSDMLAQTYALRWNGTAWQMFGGGGTVTPGGSSGDIQYNNSGSLGGLSSTGTGNVVRATSPTLVTPVLGAATATTINGTSIPSSSTLATVTSCMDSSFGPSYMRPFARDFGGAAGAFAGEWANAGKVHLSLFYVHCPITITKIRAVVATASAATCGGGACGLYFAILNKTLTTNLGSGVVTGSPISTGIKTVTLTSPTTLSVGWYYLATYSDSTALVLYMHDGYGAFSGDYNNGFNRFGGVNSGATGNGSSIALTTLSGWTFSQSSGGYASVPVVEFSN